MKAFDTYTAHTTVQLEYDCMFDNWYESLKKFLSSLPTYLELQHIASHRANIPTPTE